MDEFLRQAYNLRADELAAIRATQTVSQIHGTPRTHGLAVIGKRWKQSGKESIVHGTGAHSNRQIATCGSVKTISLSNR